MINKIISWVARIAVGKQIVAGIAWLHNLLDGRRSELILAVYAIVYVLKVGNVLPGELADNILNSLLPLLPLTLADKASKVVKAIDDNIPKP